MGRLLGVLDGIGTSPASVLRGELGPGGQASRWKGLGRAIGAPIAGTGSRECAPVPETPRLALGPREPGGLGSLPMITLRHASTTAALLRGADHLLVLGSEAALKEQARHPGLAGLSPEVQRLVTELLKDLSPGLGGAAAQALCSEAPRRVAVERAAERGLASQRPGRAEAIRSCMVKSNTGKRGKGAVLLLLDDAEHQLAATLAVAQALPLYDGRSQVTSAAVLRRQRGGRRPVPARQQDRDRLCPGPCARPRGSWTCRRASSTRQRSSAARRAAWSRASRACGREPSSARTCWRQAAVESTGSVDAPAPRRG